MKSNGALKRHLWQDHKIETKWISCTLSNCDYRSTSDEDLSKHFLDVHTMKNIAAESTVELNCSIGGCDESNLNEEQLRDHLSKGIVFAYILK